MKVLLVDFESTGVNPEEDRITEVGAMVCNKGWEPCEGEDHAWVSQLCWMSGYPALTPEVQKVTNITQGMLDDLAIPTTSALIDLGRAAAGCDFAVAYNANFDRTLFRAEVQRLGFLDNPHVFALYEMPWLCAMDDLESSADFKSKRLMHAALEYGVTVNPKLLHRAIADVELMRQLLQSAGTYPEEMFAYQMEPSIVVRAITNKPWEDGGKSNAAAKALGFRWQQVNGSDREYKNCWVKKVKERNLEKLLASPLKIVRVE